MVHYLHIGVSTSIAAAAEQFVMRSFALFLFSSPKAKDTQKANCLLHSNLLFLLSTFTLLFNSKALPVAAAAATFQTLWLTFRNIHPLSLNGRNHIPPYFPRFSLSEQIQLMPFPLVFCFTAGRTLQLWQSLVKNMANIEEDLINEKKGLPWQNFIYISQVRVWLKLRPSLESGIWLLSAEQEFC